MKTALMPARTPAWMMVATLKPTEAWIKAEQAVTLIQEAVREPAALAATTMSQAEAREETGVLAELVEAEAPGVLVERVEPVVPEELAELVARAVRGAIAMLVVQVEPEASHSHFP